MNEKEFKETIKDFTKFAPKFLVIRSKSGQVKPFALNRAQEYTHNKLESQLKETGKVRALILKGRQQGMSTLIQGRYFYKVITVRGTKAYILTHEAEATKNLFEMTQRFYDKLPTGLCTTADKASSKELFFRKYDSGYAVGTAGNKGAGRSQTIQLFHGCLAEGSLIFDPTNGGLKKIEDFLVGDLVKTHTERIASISFISTQWKECLKVILRGLTAFPLIATPEHKFWTKEGWKKLNDFKSDTCIGYPVKEILAVIDELTLPDATKRVHGGGRQFICPDSIKLSYKFGRVVGLYLAEGHIKLQNAEPKYPSCIQFAIHRKELGRTIKWIAPFHKYFSSVKTADREDCLTSVVTVYGNRFAMLMNELCGRTTGKHLPLMWDELGEDFCRGLLHGYIAGDGHSEDKCRRVRASSICSAITTSLRDLAASLGYGWASIEFRCGAIRHGRNEKDRYTFSLCGDGASRLACEINKTTPKIVNKKTKSIKPYAASSTEISNGYAWLRVTEISYAGMRRVYDFEVSHNDHSYCSIHGATHNSECGFWPHAEDHAKGVLQAVSNEPGTEIILESTANGIGNYFHSTWKGAESGGNEYQAIFIPWYWQAEYTASDDNFRLTEEEEFLFSIYKEDGMTNKHLAWRRLKIRELSNDPDIGIEFFHQEFPNNAQEAFLNPIANIFINSKHVTKARKNKVESDNRLIIGVDVAIGDNDKTAIIRRRGRVAYNLETFRNMNTMEIAGMLKHVIEKEKPYRVYIDCIGVGAGVVDRLRELNYYFVEGINVARSANAKDKYRNLRAELWYEMREWFMQEMPVQIPDSDDLHGDLCNLGYKYDSSGRLLIESKDDLKARGMASPDTSDALALTFYSGFYETANEISRVTTVPAQRPGMFI
jgi:hypothetical protein